MAKKVSPPEFAATRTSSPGAKAALLRGGAGKHADRRLKRQKTRSAQKARAIAVSW